MKPGIKTTELWLTVVVGILINLGAIPVPDKFKWIASAGLVIGYAISRGLAKYESPPELPVIGSMLPAEPVDPVATELGEQARVTAEAKPKVRRKRSA